MGMVVLLVFARLFLRLFGPRPRFVGSHARRPLPFLLVLFFYNLLGSPFKRQYPFLYVSAYFTESFGHSVCDDVAEFGNALNEA